MSKSILFVLSILAAQGSLAAQEALKVHVEVKHIVIDNSANQAHFEFSPVCEVDGVVNFQDTRTNPANNEQPSALVNNCAFQFLGSTQTVKLWAGVGAYIEKSQTGASDRFVAQGAMKIGSETSTVWGASKVNNLDGMELTLDTPQKNLDSSGLRKESLRITYKFYK
ncbi:MAG: hypothetical protein AAGB31_13420 [Bdellovibrio sp.]